MGTARGSIFSCAPTAVSTTGGAVTSTAPPTTVSPSRNGGGGSFAADEQSQPLKASPARRLSAANVQQRPQPEEQAAPVETPAPARKTTNAAAAGQRTKAAPPPLKEPEPLIPLKEPVKVIELTGDRDQDMKLLLGQMQVLQAKSPQNTRSEGGGADPTSPRNDAPPLSAFEDLCDVTKSLVQTAALRPPASPKPPASPTLGGGSGPEAGDEEQDEHFKQETAIKEQMKNIVRQSA